MAEARGAVGAQGRPLNQPWGSTGFLEGMSSKRNMKNESELAVRNWGQEDFGKREGRGEPPSEEVDVGGQSWMLYLEARMLYLW